ncbi:hypothetical protein GCM10010266_12930 [Streptomyces griseomycini]|nr:hypothetical protein GCM10010266_12930 [Streptomyces griseomycini]
MLQPVRGPRPAPAPVPLPGGRFGEHRASYGLDGLDQGAETRPPRRPAVVLGGAVPLADGAALTDPAVPSRL